MRPHPHPSLPPFVLCWMFTDVSSVQTVTHSLVTCNLNHFLHWPGFHPPNHARPLFVAERCSWYYPCKTFGFSFIWMKNLTYKLFCRTPSFTQLIPESPPLASSTRCHYLSFCPNLHSLFSPLLPCLSSPLLCFIYQFHSLPTFICIICFSDSSPSSLYIKLIVFLSLVSAFFPSHPFACLSLYIWQLCHWINFILHFYIEAN